MPTYQITVKEIHTSVYSVCVTPEWLEARYPVNKKLPFPDNINWKRFIKETKWDDKTKKDKGHETVLFVKEET